MAIKYLMQKGYEIIEINYRCRMGEIDIIARDLEKEELVFAEVKYRYNNSMGEPGEAVGVRKQWKISKVAAFYLTEQYKSLDVACRFDVIGILGNEIIHYENAFEYIG